ncbi:hypothetical protein L596_002040 [Steinernema carpocapsae]|uniref:Uncharacterized protein n=1 Tax=Steinernema carpocapsae TaxID=34508 RepID=A0A4U8URY7_STECR|nr:hypothetical protein L596_002040 [Steinernema carpocapsae]
MAAFLNHIRRGNQQRLLCCDCTNAISSLMMITHIYPTSTTLPPTFLHYTLRPPGIVRHCRNMFFCPK